VFDGLKRGAGRCEEIRFKKKAQGGPKKLEYKKDPGKGKGEKRRQLEREEPLPQKREKSQSYLKSKRPNTQIWGGQVIVIEDAKRWRNLGGSTR